MNNQSPETNPQLPAGVELPFLQAEPVPDMGVTNESLVEEIVEGTTDGWLKRGMHHAARAGQIALVSAELLPLTNEGSRLALFGLAESLSRDPFIPGATLGAATFAIEYVGGLATANLLNSPTNWGSRLIAKINEKGKKVGIPMDKNLPTGIKTFFTFMGGTPVGMLLEQREDAERTVEQNRKYSLITSTWQAGALAVLGTMAADGINVGLDDPKKGLLIGAGLAVIGGAGAWAKKHTSKLRGWFGRNKQQGDN